ncbi:mucin-19-like [Anopheles arabiensis]|uniref:Uncharacterized protein n=1 Tax=Anopheles arabiensis TaxID=7173 RepID=A0A8W7LW95_ANOAR|nr:mucin-19-like [Anopheles arabiensis]XP_040173633.1 mucin-19-like [Anopheles arabiensis]
MEQIVTTSVCFLMILAIVRVGSVPAPSDIISGREFLSILMKPTAETSPSSGAANGGGAAAPARNFRGLRKFRHFYLDQSGTNDDTILPIEALFTSQEDLDRSSTRFYGYRRGGQRASSNGGSTTTTTSTSTTPSTTTVEEEALVNGVDPGITTTASPPPPSWHVDGEPTTPPMEANGGTAGESAELTTLDDASTTTVPPLEEEEEKDQTTAALPPVVVARSPGGARYAKRAKAIQQPVESAAHHSHAHRTELSVEELSPTISKEEEPAPLDDSAKGESSAVAKLIAPPAGSPQRYRTQRKQESAGGQPFQTVRYHDRKPTTGDVGTLAWRDNDGDQKAQLKPAMREKSSSSIGPAPMYSEPARFYSEPAQYYSEPAKVYSEPARIYGEPEKVYSEPARVYSEPAKVYSEPARIYSEPAKVYSEPAKIYSQPSSYWQTVYSARPADPTTTAAAPTTTTMPTTTTTTTTAEPVVSTEPSTAPVRLVFNELDKIPYDQLNAPTVDGEDAGSSIHSAIGKFVPKQSHGQGAGEEDPRQTLGVQQQQQQQQPAVVVQTLAPGVLGPGDDSKVGYVVEGRNYRKYRVEEKTPDGFIVGEYGVLSHNDGNLRGVRYTADSDINPRLIYDALLKFLSL